MADSAGAVRFTVGGDPVPWGRVKSRIVTSKKTGQQFVSSYTPAKTRSGEGAVRFHGANAMNDRSPLSGAIELVVRVYVGIPPSWSKGKKDAARRGDVRPTSTPDWDNFGKLPSDALNGVTYPDDCFVVDSFVSLWYSDRPRTEISVRKVAESHQDWKAAR